MELLTGCDISIHFDEYYQVYVAVVGVGRTSQEFADPDPVKALGVAIMLQARLTPDNLLKELKARRKAQNKSLYP